MRFIFLIILVVVIWYFAGGIRVIREYERGVVFRLGKLQPQEKQPGLRVVIPVIDVIKKVSLRMTTMPIQSQKILTNDSVSIDVAAVAYFKVNNASRSIVAIEDVDVAVNQIAQTTVRNIVGQSDLDVVLANTEQINISIKAILDNQTEHWGVEVPIVELKDIQLPETMQRAMARTAEAEREKKAKVIAAEGEQLSAAKLGEAADIITKHPIALQLRNLQVLGEIAVEKNSTIIFPNQMMTSVEEIKRWITAEVPEASNT